MYQGWQTPPEQRRQRYHLCGQPISWGDYYLGYVLQPRFWVDDQPVLLCPCCQQRLSTTTLALHPLAYPVVTVDTRAEADQLVARLEARAIPAAAVFHWLGYWTVNTKAEQLERARSILTEGGSPDALA